MKDVYLVIFRTYASHADHEHTLSNLLPTPTPPTPPTPPSLNSSHLPLPWRVVPRRNLASTLPTDFLVVHTAPYHTPSNRLHPSLSTPSPHPLTSTLLSLPSTHPSLIKHVTRERSYRHLLSIPPSSATSPPRPPSNPSPSPSPLFTAFDPYVDFDADPAAIGSFPLPRRFSTIAPLSQTFPPHPLSPLPHPTSPLHNSTPIPSHLHPRQLYPRRVLLSSPDQSVSRRYLADVLWSKGHTGAGIRVAVFDTGLSSTHPHFRRIRERTNWTDNDTLDDELGHGTHVAGVIASTHADCSGFAPDAEVYVYRVFNSRQLSFTSWFLDAFNHAIHTRVHVLNLSIGGPDFRDLPFVDKVLEMSANHITVVSAIGNDGPLYGTLNNPADQMDVIGVGGLTADDAIAGFSSRGMTTWELPAGYGRVKPDVVAFAINVMGSRVGGGCKPQTGTSAASPVVAGAVALLASSIPPARRAAELNPARLKQALTVGAKPVRGANIFEQGAGKLDLLAAFDHLASHLPHVSAIPAVLDLTACPYMWPYCSQELYYSSVPVLINVTLLNSISVSSIILDPPTFTITSPTSPLNSSSSSSSSTHPVPPLLSISFLYSQPLWPWSGYLSLQLTVTHDVSTPTLVTGLISLTVQSSDGTLSPLTLPLRANIIPTPPRASRLLWDQYHNLRYPSGYFPRDNLDVKTDTLDWNGDHPHTNYRDVYTQLRGMGYYVEVLGRSALCFDPALYGVLMVVDGEEEWWGEEVARVYEAVVRGGMGLLVVGEWYNVQVMREVKFWDENTASWWTPVTGGANVPALNDLLAPFGMAWSSHVVKGRVNVTGEWVPYGGGTTIARFPKGGYVVEGVMQNGGSGAVAKAYPVLGMWQGGEGEGGGREGGREGGSGRVLLWGDSNCLDLNNNPHGICTHLLHEIMAFLSPLTPSPSPLLRSAQRLTQPYVDPTPLPERMAGNNLARYSKVISPSASPACAAPFDTPMPTPVPFTRRVNVSAGAGVMWGGGAMQGMVSGSLGVVMPVRDGGGGGGGGKGGDRHSFRTGVTTAVLLLGLGCGMGCVWLLWLFHAYGAVEGKRRGEEEGEGGGEGKEGGGGGRERGGWGRPMWLWVARTAPSCCLTLLRLAHSAIMTSQPSSLPPTPVPLTRSTSTGQWRQEKGPEIITDSE